MPLSPATAVLSTADASLEVHLLGVVDFDALMALQEWTAYQTSERTDGRGTLLLCEHPPLITMGADSSSEDLAVDEATRERTGLDTRWVSRGGGTIAHGPGSLGIYPLLPLDRLGCGVVDFRRRLELACVDACRELKIAAKRRDDAPGVWTRGGQVGFFGAAMKYGVSTHGLHVHVEPAPSLTRLVHPTTSDDKMTSLASLRVRPATMHVFRQAILHAVVNRFDYQRFHVHTGHEQLRRATRRVPVPVAADID